MKLKTEIMTRHDGVRFLCVGVDELFGPDAVSCDPEVMHDLMAAHALMQAIADRFPPSMQMYRNDIMGRGDELMAAWGFAKEKAE